ncbi:7,8-dihydro-8-oxoguanine triphosphatase [Cryptococcus deuterogattii 99/473]|uniref:7,8-dihydro-8-oxoguanine triphosphatase n=2 Tax=Cryptococcus deuterogattii TaxID=1859096 RepID=A0A0D0T5G6_9TREE|nr:7,8-dihydro-8-oxoguanine triphosphatase [Cryptococcus deuterogattii R265]KIR26351.1 7,8-dihydro-8-oxoguanine triphosphatase [Cryptococcus deuterogattii LA55]KIR32981.1 7,8-dihydro-8-oxoguanine triphosphatase [Cryptococcus deuterogattii MMRL2647]KIR41142.1 7,8-dihydro-8-oxoguanine triphosphatase [Cryptococcus deuterogattii Ram5]KIR72497.1 7,8-dihydro-8-oxoguanine triphosphatase [Cryptococcus deuterogattii CA1014]KIR92091.1 7,8-dihydro-8-oxoguanine triphosphatase [Cryptococcus deuterogattii C
MASSSIPIEFNKLPIEQSPFSSQTPVRNWAHLQNIKPWPIEYSLVFVVDRQTSKVLLGLKRRGMGVGLYNGYGGKPEPREPMLECALRELHEESGLVVNRFDLHHKGILLTSRPDPGTQQEKSLLRIHIYACTSWTGTPETTEEMEPEWIDIADLPLKKMWPEARIYVPPLLQSILQDKLNTEMLLARVDYEYLTSVQAPTPSPPLLGLSISFENGDGDDLPMERLSGWWMTFTTARVLSLVAENSGI